MLLCILFFFEFLRNYKKVYDIYVAQNVFFIVIVREWGR